MICYHLIHTRYCSRKSGTCFCLFLARLSKTVFTTCVLWIKHNYSLLFSHTTGVPLRLHPSTPVIKDYSTRYLQRAIFTHFTRSNTYLTLLTNSKVESSQVWPFWHQIIFLPTKYTKFSNQKNICSCFCLLVEHNDPGAWGLTHAFLFFIKSVSALS